MGISDGIVQFKLDGEPKNVKLERLSALKFYQPTKAQFPPPVAKVWDAYGNQFNVSEITNHGTKLHLKTVAGLELDMPQSTLRLVDYASGNSTKLTALPPRSTSVSPFFSFGQKPDPFFSPRTGTSFFGPLKLGGQQHTDGMSLFGGTTLKYHLTEPYRFFKATAGIDDSVRDKGQVHLLIQGGGKTLFEQSIQGTVPVEIQIPLDQVKDITLQVQFGETDIGDILNLVQPRLVK